MIKQLGMQRVRGATAAAAASRLAGARAAGETWVPGERLVD